MKYWDDAWGLVGGCAPCSPGCRSCWSAAAAYMRSHQKNQKIRAQYEGLTCLRNGIPTYNGTIRLFHDRLELPLRRRKPTVWSIWNDLFHEDVPEDFIGKTFRAIDKCRQHIFMVLTKRPDRMLNAIHWLGMSNEAPPLDNFPHPNVWYGLTVCNQEEADAKIPVFLQVPGKKFLSIEPMLSEIDFRWQPYAHQAAGETYREYIDRKGSVNEYESLIGINAVIAGGETGHDARPTSPIHALRMRDDCLAAGVPFLFKQWGSAMCVSADAFGYDRTKRNGGRLLDGREHNDMPWRSCL